MDRQRTFASASSFLFLFGIAITREAAIAAVAGVTLIVVGLVGALMVQIRARRRLDDSATQARRFRAVIGDLLLATAKSPVRTAAHVDECLRRIGDAAGVDDVWLWQFGDPSDPTWTHARLQRGGAVTLLSVEDLPRPLRERMASRSAVDTVLATALDAHGEVLGALFWVPSRPRPTWSFDEADRLRVFSILFACDLERQRTGEALQRGLAMKDAILSSLPARIAVLDRRGTILTVNTSWSESAWATYDGHAIEPGANYQALCRAAAEAGCPAASDAATAIADVCAGRRPEYELEYRAPDVEAERWFLMKVTPLQRDGGGAVVTHTNISERKRAELVARRNEERFRRLADVLPVGVWISGVDGACVYVNRTWLTITGRPIEQELGTGWLEAVHPEDRERCMGTYLRAFEARQPFSMEFRIRRHDGQYRWLLDRGVAWTDVDGSFAGYLGGAIDFTDQRDAEQALRDLSGKLIAAQEDERRRIARDLHDSVGQRTALLSIRLHELRRHLPAAGDATTILDQLRHDSDSIARDVHSLSHRLHSAKLDALGLVAAIASECREMSERGVLVQCAESGVPAVSSEVALCLFRIVQEALSNVVKHSRASTARVTLAGTGDVLVLTVEDGGVGFVADQRVEGLGLVSIRERVRLVGGELSVRSAPGQGTVIEARVSVQSAAAAHQYPDPASLDLSSHRTEHSPPLFLSDTSRTSPG